MVAPGRRCGRTSDPLGQHDVLRPVRDEPRGRAARLVRAVLDHSMGGRRVPDLAGYLGVPRDVASLLTAAGGRPARSQQPDLRQRVRAAGVESQGARVLHRAASPVHRPARQCHAPGDDPRRDERDERIPRAPGVRRTRGKAHHAGATAQVCHAGEQDRGSDADRRRRGDGSSAPHLRVDTGAGAFGQANSPLNAGITSPANSSMLFIVRSCGRLPTWKMPWMIPQPDALMHSRIFWRTVSGLPTIA